MSDIDEGRMDQKMVQSNAMYDRIQLLEQALEAIKLHHEANINAGWSDGCGCCSTMNLDEDYDFQQVSKILNETLKKGYNEKAD